MRKLLSALLIVLMVVSGVPVSTVEASGKKQSGFQIEFANEITIPYGEDEGLRFYMWDSEGNWVDDWTKYKVTWRHNGKIIPNADGTCYIIENAKLEDEGTYEIEVTDGIQTARQSCKVNISTNLYIEDDWTHHECRNIGEAFEARVNATSKLDHLTYKWMKYNFNKDGGYNEEQGQLLEETSNVLTIDSLKRSDFGVYKCEVSDGVETKSVEYFLTRNIGLEEYYYIEMDYESTVEYGESTTLSFKAIQSETGNEITDLSDYRIVWTHDGKVIEGANSTSYTIENITKEASGFYEVEVSDGSQTEYGSCYIDVDSKLEFNDDSWFDERIELGKRIQLDASATSKTGKVQYAWKFIPMDDGSFSYDLERAVELKETSSVVAIDSIKVSDYGYYVCEVTDGVARRQKSFAVRPYNELRAWIKEDHNRVVELEDRVELSVAAFSNLDVTYQWYKNKELLPGKTKAKLVIDRMSQADYGEYECVVRDGISKVVCKASLKTFDFPLDYMEEEGAITYRDTYIGLVGKSLALDLSQVNKAKHVELTYEWYKKSKDKFGNDTKELVQKGKQSSYTIEKLEDWSETNSNEYYVKVTDGTCTSEIEICVYARKYLYFTHEGKPVIDNVYGLEAVIGEPYSYELTPVLQDGYSATYQWYKSSEGYWKDGGEKLEGQTTPTLTIPSVTEEDLQQSYYCVATVTNGKITEQVQGPLLSIEEKREEFYVQLDHLWEIDYGKELTLYFKLLDSDGNVVEDTSKYNIRWENKKGEIVQRDATSYTIKQAGAEDAGEYSVYVAKGGRMVASSCYVEIDTKLEFEDSYSEHKYVKLGERVQLEGKATSILEKLQYKWKMVPMEDGIFSTDLDKAVPLNETGSVLSIDQFKKLDYGYYVCEVSDGINTERKSFYVRPYNRLDAELKQKYTQVVELQERAELSVEVSSKEDVTYQWYKNNEPLQGQTKDTLVIERMSKEDYGKYECVVRDGISKVSCYASLATFDLSTECTTGEYAEVQGKSVSAYLGESFTLDLSKIKKVKDAKLTFEWYKNSDWDGMWDNKELVQSGPSDRYVIDEVKEKSEANTNEYYVKVTDGICTDSMYIWVSPKDHIYFMHDGESVDSYMTAYGAVLGEAYSFELTPVIRDGYRATYQWYAESDGWNQQPERLEGQTTPTLSFPVVTKEDFDKEFYCEATVTNGKFTQKVKGPFIRLRREPKFEIRMDYDWNIEYGKDQTLFFELYDRKGNVIKDLSEYKIRWENDNDEVIQRDSTSYTITNASKEHAGNYYVYVEHEGMERSMLCRVEIDTKLKFNTRYDYSRNVKLGESIQLDATATSVLPKVEYSWEWKPREYDYEKGARIPLKETSAKLTLSNIKKSDYGVYICTATDGVNTRIKEFWVDPYLEVVWMKDGEVIEQDKDAEGYGASVVELKERVELSVSATSGSDNNITYQWYKGDEPLAGQTGPNLVIESMSKEDYDWYGCEVSDGLTTRYSYYGLASFDVGKYRYEFAGFLGKGITVELKDIEKAKHVTLNYNWYKEDENEEYHLVQQGAKNSLAIDKLENASNYRVDVTDGTFTKSVWVYVYPKNHMYFMHNGKYVTAELGEERGEVKRVSLGDTFSYTLTPVLDEGYTATYQWYKGKGHYWVMDSDCVPEKIKGQTTPTLNLGTLKEEHFGDGDLTTYYYCVATVSNGKTTELVQSKMLALEKKEFLVRFNSNGGSTVKTQVITGGSSVEKPADPTKEGYVFKGWELDSKAYDFAAPVKANITLHAVWEKIVPKFNVTFKSDDKVLKTETVEQGKGATAPTVTKPGHIFKGWDQAFDAVKADMTVTAIWEKVSVEKGTIQKAENVSDKAVALSYAKVAGAKGYEIRYSVNADMKDAKTVAVNGDATTSYTINGLECKPYYVQVRAYKVDSTNANVYGEWSDVASVEVKRPIQYYTVTFKSDDKVLKTETVEEGKGATAPTVTKAGHIFKGWDQAFDAVKANMTVTAIWEKVSVEKGTIEKAENISDKKINLTYKKVEAAKGYEIRYSVSKDMKDATVVQVNADAATNYEISNLEYKPYYVQVRAYKIDSTNANVYGDWSDVASVEVKQPIKFYTVTFKSDNKVVKTQTVQQGKGATAPSVTKAGHRFAGWDKSFNKVTQNVTVTAKWQKVSVEKAAIQKLTNVADKKMEITYKKVSGSKGYEIRYALSKDMKNAKTVEAAGESTVCKQIGGLQYKTYYAQVRAYKLDSTNKKVYGAWSDTKNVAVKKPVPSYKVTFKSDNKVVKTQTVQKGKNATAPTVKKAGHTFAGWSRSYNKVSGNITVTAKWKKVSVEKVQLTSVKNSKGKNMEVAYKKVNGAAGYQIRYSTNKNMKNAKVVTTKNVKQKISKLDKKTYYVEVRAYKKDSTNKNVYGAWSAKKKVAVKK